jgi:hypothetical protein
VSAPIGNPWVILKRDEKGGLSFLSGTMRLPGFGISPVLDRLESVRRFRTKASAEAEARRVGRAHWPAIRWDEAERIEAEWNKVKRTPHQRTLMRIQADEPAFAVKCSCGWYGRTYSTKNKAASAHGMHVAAARRREERALSR